MGTEIRRKGPAASGGAAGRALRFGSTHFGVAGESDRRERRWRAYRAAGLVFCALLMGTTGFYVLGSEPHDLLTSLYMTVITLSTVGFSEVIPIHESDELMVFTITLTVLGVAATFYFFTSVMAMVVEGDPLFLVWRRRMKRSIESLEDHVVVAGAGSNGIHVIRELWAAQVPMVVIEADPDRMEHLLGEFGDSLLHLIGDAHDDLVLEAAGLARARGLIATLHDDRDNLFLCLTARTINPRARIIAKAEAAGSAEKFQRAGVDSVVSPALIGGRRLAHEMVHPHVTSFVEGLIGQPDAEVNLMEVDVAEGSELAGRSFRDADLRGRTDCLVLGVRAAPGDHYRFNPPPETVLAPGASLMVLGEEDQVASLRLLLSPR